MHSATVLSFLRPTLVVVACFFVVTGISRLLPEPGPSDEEWRDIEEFASKLESLTLPKPSMSVKEVVQVQIAGLSEQDTSRGVAQCMLFASPENRMVTGPLERFGRMVRGEEFRILADPDRVLIGEPTYVEGIARVLVTLVDGRTLRSFVWVLSKQTVDPYVDCWMTDGVFPLDDETTPNASEVPDNMI